MRKLACCLLLTAFGAVSLLAGCSTVALPRPLTPAALARLNEAAAGYAMTG
ncbi:MAG TPA: hypothetical protein VH083_00635 [Myxococcales bacterium]|jgi:hypothetical protein|nr:hypothetical protein [Myxococcales bacterium]